MTDEYGQVTPWTLAEDARSIKDSLAAGPVHFALADGCGAQVRITLGPRRAAVDTVFSRYEPPVDPAGFLVAVDRIGATWVQPRGVMEPSWIYKHVFDGRGDGWLQMAAVLAVLLTHIREPAQGEAMRLYTEDWLAGLRAELVPWEEPEEVSA